MGEPTMKKYVLVLFEGIPDENYVGIIPSDELDEKIRKALDILDGEVVNGNFDLSKEENLNVLDLVQDAFFNSKEYCTGKNTEYDCRYFSYMETYPRFKKINIENILVEKIYRLAQFL